MDLYTREECADTGRMTRASRFCVPEETAKYHSQMQVRTASTKMTKLLRFLVFTAVTMKNVVF
jgi:hypothetical protein